MNAIKLASEENTVVANLSHHPAREADTIDWRCRLFDSDGFEHRLVSLGGVQVVTKVSFCYAIWDRRTGECMSFDQQSGYRISNTPLSDIELTKRHFAACQALEQMMRYSHQ